MNLGMKEFDAGGGGMLGSQNKEQDEEVMKDNEAPETKKGGEGGTEMDKEGEEWNTETDKEGLKGYKITSPTEGKI